MNKYFKGIKEYIFLYILLIIIFSLVIFCTSNFRINLIQILMILFLIICGLFPILYYNLNKETRIETLALIIILFFGTCCLFLSPILDICDEDEHFTRADIQSNGQIIPVYDENIHRYNASALTNDMILNWHKTLFNTNLTHIQMNHSEIHVSSAFAQNPFYAYLFSSFGVFIAKFFNLTEIWALYLGRFFNLVLYASLVYYSIKKTSIFKYQYWFVHAFL